MPTSEAPLLAFGAHPDDLEFGAGGVLALETRRGRPVHLVVCSRGESATHGTPAQRTAEAEEAARILGATLEFVDLGGDAHFEVTVARTLALAALVRRHKPAHVFAPTLDANQHPDHTALAQLVRNACRLARYGGVEELRGQPAHKIDALFHYAITSDFETSGPAPVLIDVSTVVDTWTRAMSAHASQAATRDYVDLQLTRARLHGARAGVSHALPLWPAEPVVLDSLAPLARTARRF